MLGTEFGTGQGSQWLIECPVILIAYFLMSSLHRSSYVFVLYNSIGCRYGPDGPGMAMLYEPLRS